jgi:hypothetical protein
MGVPASGTGAPAAAREARAATRKVPALRLLLRLALAVASLAFHLVAVLLFTGLASLGYSHLTAERFAHDAQPPAHFPLVASVGEGYRLLRWGEYRAHPAAPGERALLLSSRRGGFTLDSVGSFTPRVDFEVLEYTGGRQRIAVTWADDDYRRYSRYVTDGVSVVPEYFRIWGAGMAFVGIVPGILAAWLLGQGLRRLWRASRHRRTATR